MIRQVKNDAGFRKIVMRRFCFGVDRWIVSIVVVGSSKQVGDEFMTVPTTEKILRQSSEDVDLVWTRVG